MQTEAIFENINKRIREEIRLAQDTIYVAVAWFTDYILFHELEKKAQEGCKVFVLTSNDFINKQSKIDYDTFQENFKVFLFGDSKTKLIHHKFCVIDKQTVITGSYNWTHKAKSNEENVVITKGDNVLAEQFIGEFNKLLEQFNIKDNVVDYRKDLDRIIKRLEIIKNFILIEETESINTVSNKLKPYKELNSILKSLKQKEYATVINQIQDFIKSSKNENLTLWTDEELVALKLELKNLEIQLNAYDNEKIELEKQLLDFQYRHSLEVGSIMSEILKLRKHKFRDNKKKFKEAEKDEKQYNQQLKEDSKIKKFELNTNEERDLKKMYRRASFLCHPNIISDDLEEEAKQTFIELKKAYDIKDIKKVENILNTLENGNFFKSKSETVTENEKLKLAIQKIKLQINNVLENIVEIKENETYQTVQKIKDWNEYFSNLKTDLNKELEHLKNETEIITTANTV